MYHHDKHACQVIMKVHFFIHVTFTLKPWCLKTLPMMMNIYAKLDLFLSIYKEVVLFRTILTFYFNLYCNLDLEHSERSWVQARRLVLNSNSKLFQICSSDFKIMVLL